jgi:hypothetical protein
MLNSFFFDLEIDIEFALGNSSRYPGSVASIIDISLIVVIFLHFVAKLFPQDIN